MSYADELRKMANESDSDTIQERKLLIYADKISGLVKDSAAWQAEKGKYNVCFDDYDPNYDSIDNIIQVYYPNKSLCKQANRVFISLLWNKLRELGFVNVEVETTIWKLTTTKEWQIKVKRIICSW